MHGVPSARVGCDLQPVADVADAVRRFGDRYLDRVFTPAEATLLTTRGADSLAATFAAKEAVLKLVGRPDGTDPRSIRTDREPDGRPTVTLVGDIADHARNRGIDRIDLSLSHAGGLAMAVAVAVSEPAGPDAAGPDGTRREPTRPDPARPHPEESRVTSTAPDTLSTPIREIVAEHGRLTRDARTIPGDADLYSAGLTSHASVTVMLALEDRWDVEFPAHLLRKSTFGSVDAIRAALLEIGVTP